MSLVVLILAATYTLPDAGGVPAPDAAARARIDKSLAILRRGDPDEADTAVRDLALVGEAALPFVVKRLNEASAGERLLLLAAVRSVKRAAPLLEQARKDESPAIRAWAAPLPARRRPSLRRLAARYLDLLAVAEEKRRLDAGKDLDALEPRVGRPVETFKGMRERMRDRILSYQVQTERQRAADRFARAGGRALRERRLKPSLKDPVFVAYLALLREERGGALFYALPSLVAVGEPLAPVLEPLLDRENHDPGKILRILFAVRKDGGRGLLERFAAFRPDTQRALVRTTFGATNAAFLARAALAKDETVRSAALDALLRLPAPAGVDVAAKLLDPDTYSMNEFRRAAKLLARAGKLKTLADYAIVTIPGDGSPRAGRMVQLQRASTSVLRSYRDDELAKVFLAAESRTVRLVGLELTADAKKLVQLARATNDKEFAQRLALRAVELGDEPTVREAITFLRRGDARLPIAVHQVLGRRGLIHLLVELAADERERRQALSQLAQLATIDAKYEPALLDIFKAQPDQNALEALLPLATPAAGEALKKAKPEDALAALAGRAETAERVKLAVPLLGLLQGADTDRLVQLRKAASILPDVEPGLFYALYQAWGSIKVDPEAVNDNSPAMERVDLLRALARSTDKQSARLLFDDLLKKRIKEPPFVLGVLRAAARLLDGKQLARLVPVLTALAAKEYPRADRQPPPVDKYRWTMLGGGVLALGYARVDGALDMLCELVLDPKLQPDAFEFRSSAVPNWSLWSLRHYPARKVFVAFRKALARAEESGRLAGLHPDYLFGLVKRAHGRRVEGRGLAEVRLALCDVLERLPWEGDALYEKMRALGELRRYREAAAAARAFAAHQKTSGYAMEDGFRTPAFVEGRARLYDAMAAGKPEAFPADFHDPFLLNLLAWYTLFYVKDLDRAERAARAAVRGSAGLYHPYRDTLAGVRIARGDPEEALRLIDERRLLPVRRSAGSGWHLYFNAKANLAKGRVRAARRDLESALTLDRRLLPTAKADPAFKPLTDVFKQVEEDYLDGIFAWGG